MKSLVRLRSFLILAILSFLLSACLADLEKPTGLEDRKGEKTGSSSEAEIITEDHEDNKTENNEANNLIDQDSTTNNEAKNEDEKEEVGQADKAEKETDPKTSKEDSQADKSPTKSKSTKSKGKKDRNNSSENSKPSKGKGQSKPEKDKSDHKKPTNPPKEEEAEKETEPTITHSIVIAAEGSHGQKICQEKKYPTCPEDGSAEVPLPPTKTFIENGMTVLEALIQITVAEEIHMDYRGGQGATAYIQGMGNVYEFDRGQGSGWMYRINGIFPDRGAGVVPLCDGDVIEWLYTTNLGRDLNADLKPFRRDGKCP